MSTVAQKRAPLEAAALKPRHTQSRPVGVRMPISIAEALERFVERRGVTVSSAITVAVREYLERNGG
jgi:hypothetical protein